MTAHGVRNGAIAILSLALGLSGSTWAAADPSPTPPPASSPGGKNSPDTPKMSSHSQELLLEALSAGKSRVTVMTLTAPGSTKAVAEKLRALGASVGYVHDKLGYVRASVPTQRAEQITDIPQVRFVDLDEVFKVPSPTADPGPTTKVSPWTGPTPETPEDNPYMPTADTGAVAFKKANPTFDGRGVTIGVLDSGVDLDHPALQKTTTGARQVTDWFTATDPLTEGDLSWRIMLTRVKGATATYNDQTWTLPNREGADFAINMFRESAAAGSDEFEGDVDRDGKTTGAWGVLYDYKSGDVWVDVNGDHDFTNDTVMRPYKEKNDVGHFGTDNPATREVERVPFVVEFRKNVDLTPAGRPGVVADAVNIGTVASAHGTHVAGIAAGNLPGWKIGGAAPGATIVSGKACVYAGGCTSVALTEGMIELVANRKVDIVNMSIGGLPALNDGNNTRSALYNRLIDEYGVQIFISAGNSGPGVNTLGDPSVATDVVSVAAGASKDTWLANYGASVTAPYWVQPYSSTGPREDGGFKPNILAPGSAISAVPQFLGPQDIPQVSYKLPNGYAMFNGTSMASPQATGAATLLLSAARQSDIPVTPRQLRSSIYDTARFIKGLEARSQGNGLMRVDQAWKVLKKSPEVDNAYTISAPVCSPLSDLLATPQKGTGIYNRCPAAEGGQSVGQAKTYPVTVTRTAGPADDVSHTLTWIGNDGTYSSPTTASLPLGTPVTVQVSATPQTAGSHSAILDITPVKSAVRGTRMMADVIVADDLSKAPFSTSTSGRVERTRSNSLFVTVPKGARALQVNLAGIANGSAVRFLALTPQGVPVEPSAIAGSCYTAIGNAARCKPTSRAYLDPMPGVWEITVDASRRSPTTANPYRLTASVQGVTIEPAVTTVPSVTVGTPHPLSWTFRNDFGTATVRGRGSDLGSARVERPRINQGETKTYTVDVPAGMSKLEVAIGKTSDANADLDLVVKDSQGREVGKSADADSEESVTIDKPAAGTYTVEVDGYEVAAGGTDFDYRDTYFGAALGSLKVENRSAVLANGQTMKVNGSVVATAPVAEGRVLLGVVRAVNSEESTMGTAEVRIEKVATR